MGLTHLCITKCFRFFLYQGVSAMGTGTMIRGQPAHAFVLGRLDSAEIRFRLEPMIDEADNPVPEVLDYYGVSDWEVAVLSGD